MLFRIPWKSIGVVIILILIVIAVSIIWWRVRGNAEITVNISRPAIIKQIRSLARLETASFTIEQIIDAKTSETGAIKKFLFGDKILLVAHGQVVAGFDLSQISEADIKMKEKTIELNLPKPQILSNTLDNSKTKVYDRQQGIFRRNDTDLESKARSEAEKSILKSACTGGILEVATENAKRQIHTLLSSLGFETITINIPEGSCEELL